MDFDETWYLSFFSKLCREDSGFIKIWQELRVLYTTTFPHLWQYLAELFLEWGIFRLKVVQKINTHILYTVTFFWGGGGESCRLWDNVQKHGRARRSTNDVTIWRIQVTYWISKVTPTHPGTRMRLTQLNTLSNVRITRRVRITTTAVEKH
jgi:hypothetical protein